MPVAIETSDVFDNEAIEFVQQVRDADVWRR